MNTDVTAEAGFEILSDGSKTWHVLIRGEGRGGVRVECLNEAAAHRAANRLYDIFSEGGAA